MPAASPSTPVDPAESAGVWPRPRLAKRATALALNATQWGYVLAGYTLWDGGRALWEEALRPLARPSRGRPPRGELAWAALCLLADGRAGAVHLPRPAPRTACGSGSGGTRRRPGSPCGGRWTPDWEEDAAEEAEEDEREHARRAQAHRPPVADAGNPLGWVVD